MITEYFPRFTVLLKFVFSELGATAQGLLSAVQNGLGACVGAMLGGALYARLGGHAMYGIGSSLSLVGMAVLAVGAWKHRRDKRRALLLEEPSKTLPFPATDHPCTSKSIEMTNTQSDRTIDGASHHRSTTSVSVATDPTGVMQSPPAAALAHNHDDQDAGVSGSTSTTETSTSSTSGSQVSAEPRGSDAHAPHEAVVGAGTGTAGCIESSGSSTVVEDAWSCRGQAQLESTCR